MIEMTLDRRCPLCLTAGRARPVRGGDARAYFLCEVCRLIFVDEAHHLPPGEEQAHYLTHENSIENAGYVRFLERVVEPMRPYLARHMKGLDYGCGPGPTLSAILKRRGLACQDYDPLFVPSVLEPPYDFVFSTECFEHFRAPAEEIERLRDLLRPGGFLAVMTERWVDLERFASWYYTRDPTHIAFYHAQTFDFLCRRWGFIRVAADADRVVVLRRQAAGDGGL